MKINFSRALIQILLILILFLMFSCDDTTGGSVTHISFIVSFDSQSSTLEANPTSKTVTSPATTINALPTPPTKTGYDFAGWFTAINGQGIEFTSNSTVSSDITVYAHWVNPGYKFTYTAEGITFKMVYVPGKTFPTGTDDLGTGTVANAYWVGETEVTYELWSVVLTWAIANGYTFASNGEIGSGNSGSIQQPVVTINWRNSIVWSNAATEWYNAKKGTNYTCVYKVGSTPIRNSADANAAQCDNVIPDASAKGFRLPTSNEWELAARWRNDATNTVGGYTNPYFTKGNSSSGAYTYFDNLADNDPANGIYDNKDTNDLLSVYGHYWNGNWAFTGITSTAVVKSKANNALLIFDMSGNVYEWCFNWHPSYDGVRRVYRGGSYFQYSSELQIGILNGYFPYYGDGNIGFRIVRTQ